MFGVCEWPVSVRRYLAAAPGFEVRWVQDLDMGGGWGEGV
jgi:hypothetical protein